jgi:hypothetical protein
MDISGVHVLGLARNYGKRLRNENPGYIFLIIVEDWSGMGKVSANEYIVRARGRDQCFRIDSMV